MIPVRFTRFPTRFAAVCALGALAAFPALAVDQKGKANIDILPALSFSDPSVSAEADNPTHPALRLTPDKSELVRLDGEVATVIVGNPNHLSVMAESAKLLVLVPRAAGASFFTALDKEGNVIMQRHVIVASPKTDYVRVRRPCAADSKNCQPTRVYYCPDMCHEILMGGQEKDQSQDSAAGAADKAAAPQTAAEDTADTEAEPLQ